MTYRMGILLLCSISSLHADPLIGEAASFSFEEAQSGAWKQWTFATTALVTATTCILLIATSEGNAASSH